MKLVQITISIIFASAMLGYGFANAQSSSGGQFGTPTTATHPYTTICGDHPCKPGEVYNPGGVSSNATASTNATAGSMSAQMKISANATMTKTNGTMTNATMPSMKTSVGMSANATSTKAAGNMTTSNMTSTMSTSPKQQTESPAKQVSSGTAPADVKCPTGYQLALNKFDQRPACVSADIYAKLVARGWAS